MSNEINDKRIIKIVKEVLPEKDLIKVVDRGEWVRHIFELIFLDGPKAFLKINVHQDWIDSTTNEDRLCALLRSHQLPAPEPFLLIRMGNILVSLS
jgi:hypothetical protein